MNWDLFFKSLETLNQKISATSDKKEEVYNILVEHNKKAEIDFLIRLTTRKINKMINNTVKSDCYQKYDFNNSHSDSIIGSLNMQLSETSESKHMTEGIESLKYNKIKNNVKNKVGTPNMGVPTLFLYN